MEENEELNLIRHSFVRKKNVFFLINHLIICFIQSFIGLGFLGSVAIFAKSGQTILLRVGRIQSFYGEGQRRYNI